jgi:hypothetical protein
MKIHTSATREQVAEAMRTAMVQPDRFEEKGSRSHVRAFDVTLTGGSNRRPNNGDYNPNSYAATWDQWGVFIAAIFAIDPDSKMTYYANAADFHWQTDWRFGDGQFVRWPSDAHGDHKFEFTGTVGQQECSKCSAIKRWK